MVADAAAAVLISYQHLQTLVTTLSLSFSPILPVWGNVRSPMRVCEMSVFITRVYDRLMKNPFRGLFHKSVISRLLSLPSAAMVWNSKFITFQYSGYENYWSGRLHGAVIRKIAKSHSEPFSLFTRHTIDNKKGDKVAEEGPLVHLLSFVVGKRFRKFMYVRRYIYGTHEFDMLPVHPGEITAEILSQTNRRFLVHVHYNYPRDHPYILH